MNRILMVIFVVLVAGAYLYFGHLKGPPSRKMPDLTGLRVEQALDELKSFTPGEKKIVPPQSEGLVNGQEPAPDDIWTYGDEIVLYVSEEMVIDNRDFHQELDRLLLELESSMIQNGSVPGKVIPVSGTLLHEKNNVSFSQLELLVMENLRQYLSGKQIQAADISPEDWFFLKSPVLEIPPLFDTSSRVLVLEVNINPCESTQEMRISINGYTLLERKKENTDTMVSMTVDYSTNSYADRLYREPPDYLPVPKGTKENPYANIDDLARVFAAKAVASFPPGKSAALSVVPLGAVPPKLITLVKDATVYSLSNYVKIVPGYKDFRRILERLHFEMTQQEFNLTETQAFKSADIYFLIDVMEFLPEDFVFRISMRAFWPKRGTIVRGLKALGYAEYGHFGVKAELNKTAFKSGENAYIEVQPVGRSCFVWVYNVTADGKIVLLFPHSDSDDNFFLYGETLRVPSKKDDYELKLMARHARDQEEILVVAVKHEVDFPDIETESQLGHVISRKEYERWLHSIPEKDRVVYHLEYTVEQ